MHSPSVVHMARFAKIAPLTSNVPVADKQVCFAGTLLQLGLDDEYNLLASALAGGSPRYAARLAELVQPEVGVAATGLGDRLPSPWHEDESDLLVVDLGSLPPGTLDGIVRRYTPALTLAVGRPDALRTDRRADVHVVASERRSAELVHALLLGLSAPTTQTCLDAEDLLQVARPASGQRCHVFEAAWRISDGQVVVSPAVEQALQQCTAVVVSPVYGEVPVTHWRSFSIAVRRRFSGMDFFAYNCFSGFWRQKPGADMVPLALLIR